MPRISLTVVSQVQADSHTRIELRMTDQCYLASSGAPSAKAVPHAEPQRATARGDGPTLLVEHIEWVLAG